jgi:hypothetical protein
MSQEDYSDPKSSIFDHNLLLEFISLVTYWTKYLDRLNIQFLANFRDIKMITMPYRHKTSIHYPALICMQAICKIAKLYSWLGMDW